MVPQIQTGPMPLACFAPALTDDALADYEAVAAGVPAGPVRDSLETLLRAVREWWGLPDPSPTPNAPALLVRLADADGPVRVPVTTLDPDHAAALDPHVPWPHELDAIQGLFDAIDPSNKELRDCAFHLLWFVRELSLGREPLTQDKLRG